jgi:hemerythrin-like domain-containing protein
MKGLATAGTAARTPTGILMAEHRNIEKVLACLERMAEEFEGSGALVPAVAGDALEFLRTYADRLHHGKEEAELFPAMERRGIPEHAGPTAVMRAEHVEGRARIRAMGEAVERNRTGDFVREARGYVDLLRDHILKEDQVLFPMADGILPEGEQARLLGVFDRVEASDIGPDTMKRMLAVRDALCARYGVVEVPRPAAGGCSGCCGHG